MWQGLDPPLLALRMEEGALSQGIWQPLETGKGKTADPLLGAMFVIAMIKIKNKKTPNTEPFQANQMLQTSTRFLWVSSPDCITPVPLSVPHTHALKSANHIRTKKRPLYLALLAHWWLSIVVNNPRGTEWVKCRLQGFAVMAVVMGKSKCGHNLSRLNPSQHPAKYQSNL